MPTRVGYTRNEVISIVQDIVGNSSASFLNALKTGISAWQLEFYNLHDWNFSLDQKIFFNSIIGGVEYNVLDLSFPEESIFNSNIESIVCITPGGQRKLIKATMDDIRTNDPGGISQGRPTYWYQLGFNVFGLWPIPNIVERFQVEGKHEAGFISGSDLDYGLNIPYKYQDCFVQFCLVKALRRERDPRVAQEMAMFKEQLRIAVTEDMRNLDSNLRVKTANEQFLNAGNFTLNFSLWNDGFY